MNRRQNLLLEAFLGQEGFDEPEQCDGSDCWMCNPHTVEHFLQRRAYELEHHQPLTPFPPLALVPPPKPYMNGEVLTVELQRFWPSA